jgi:adenine-specific DNA-methyltransferase
MEKLHLGTQDGVDQNIERLGELFPQVVTEVQGEDGKTRRAVDFDALRDLLGDVAEGQRERYQFTWPGKAEAKAEARRPIAKTMRPQKEKSVNWDTTQNLYIEGDNLDALKILKETYAGQVKLIYIDPPYNTGHDFVYDDDFAKTRGEYDATSGDYDDEGGRLVANTEGNGRFHSDWCSMMYPRLMLARDLLSADGAIFISIDDNEDRNLLNLCNEIFGETNFVSQIVWQKRTSPDARLNLGPAHDYVAVFAKNIDAFKSTLNKLPLSAERTSQYKNPDNDPRGPWASVDITGQVGHATSSQFYEITTPSGIAMKPPQGRCWALAETTFNALVADNRIWFGDNGSSRPRQKKFLSESEGGNVWTWWSNTEVGHNQEALKELKSLFPEGAPFDTPKPTRLMLRILALASKRDSVVVDFFSGSASMAEAVIQKNADDGGSRKFVLVQIPEETSGQFSTLTEIGEERIRRAGVKIAAEVEEANRQLKIGEDPKPVPDIGFRVLSIDSSNMRDTLATPEETTQESLFGLADNVKDGRSDMDLLFEVLPKFRIPYSAGIEEVTLGGKRCFDVNGGQLIACFDTQAGVETIEEIAKRGPDYAVMRDASMADDATQANFEELFRAYSPDTVRRVI